MQKRGVVIHHSAGTDSPDASDWAKICHHHTVVNGWQPPCGYHFGLEYIPGFAEPVVHLGRHPSRDGAHSPGANQTHLGICVVGNFEVSTPPKPIVDRLVHLVRELQSAGWVGREVLPHRALRATLCPGRHLIAALSERGLWT